MSCLIRIVKTAKLQPTIKRSRAAALIDKTPRTLARYERQGLLTPIKVNSRSVLYYEWQVRKLMAGEIQTDRTTQTDATARTRNGQFTAAKLNADREAKRVVNTPQRSAR